MRISFIKSDRDTDEPEQVEVADLEALGEALLDHACPEKGGDAWIAAGTHGRTDAHVKQVDFWTLDYDGVEPDWSKLGGWNYIAHTTHSHSAAKPSWRVIVELDESVPGPEWKARYKGKVLMHGLKSSTDGKTCNPARIWYTPGPNAEWRVNLDGMPASMPVMSAAEAVTKSLAPEDDTDGLTTDGKAFWSDVERMARSLPPSIQGQGGDDRLFEAACILRSGFCLTENATIEALEIFNERCQPPWTIDRLAHKAREARGDRQTVRGSHIPAPLKAQLETEAGQPEAESLFIDASLDTAEKLKVDWTCEALGIVPGRASMLYADPHAGKTTVQAELALAFATGTPAFGNLDVGPARQVVCIECEDDFDLRHHIGMFRRDRPLAPGMLLITRVPLFATQMSEIERIFADKPGMVFINSLRAFTPGLEENSSDFAEPLLQLASLSRKHGVPLWINHHTNKAGGVRGTSAIEAAAGNSWTLKREGPRRIMSHTAARMCSERAPFELALTPNQLTRKPVEKDRPDVEIEKAGDQILFKLRKEDRWLTRNQLLSDLPGKAADAAAALSLLVTAGLVGKKGTASMSYHHNPNMTPLS
jgi:hypothetical protein